MPLSDRSESVHPADQALHDIARRLRALIVALDGRAPRAEGASESAIARDAALLREKAVSRLAEITAEMTSPAVLPIGVSP